MTSMESRSLIFLDEPGLVFGHGQVLQYPKDGLLLFGPLRDSRVPVSLRVGVIGRPSGIYRYRRWVTSINKYIPAERTIAAHHMAYPGFETIFGCKWPVEPVCELCISDELLSGTIYLGDQHDAIYKTVGLFVDEIERYSREEDAHVDLWFVVIQEEIYTYGAAKFAHTEGYSTRIITENEP